MNTKRKAITCGASSTRRSSDINTVYSLGACVALVVGLVFGCLLMLPSDLVEQAKEDKRYAEELKNVN